MCGFFGVISNTPLLPEDFISARNSLKLLEYRGPDARQDFQNDFCYIGHQRLSIIDVRENSNQPFLSEDNRYAICFNGEIYNYLELRNQLLTLGYKFDTNSDTEVFLNCFIEWGTDALDKVDGMFSGSFHDFKNDYHVLFRDYIGQKPIYYYYGEQLVFASELNALVNFRGTKTVLNKTESFKFLLHSYFALEDTPFKKCFKLLPGHYLVKKGKSGNTIRKWVPKRINNIIKNESFALKRFDELIDESCDISLRSDVKTGIFLSGGIDSTIIAAHATKLKRNLNLISVGSSDREFDESKKSKNVASHLKKNGRIFNHFQIELNENNILENFESILKLQTEPLGDPGFVNSYFLAKESKKYMKVALSGDGADELFYGYLPFKIARYSNILNLIPSQQINLLNTLTNLIPTNYGYMNAKFKIKAFLNGGLQNTNLCFSGWLASQSFSSFTKLVNNNLYKSYLIDTKSINIDNNESNCSKLSKFYIKTLLSEFVCHHTDRASMLNSIEVRSPFLNRKIINFAYDLHDDFKFKNNKYLKWILREHCKKLGFNSEIYKQKKQGFTFPIARWFRGPLSFLLIQLKSSTDWHEGILNQNEIDALVDSHLNGYQNNYRILLNLVCLYHFKKKYPNVNFA